MPCLLSMWKNHAEFLHKFLQIRHMKLKTNYQSIVLRKTGFLLFIAFVLSGCTPSISQFSETAYRQAVQLKVQSLILVDKTTEPYADHVDEAEALWQGLFTAYEYSKGRPDNELSARQWEIMLDPDRSLMGGLLARWKQEDTLSPVFVQEIRGVISDAFDTIIGLESGKVKPDEVQ